MISKHSLIKTPHAIIICNLESIPDTASQRIISRISELEKLIQKLLNNRLLELSKYITLESSTKAMTIDQTSLKNAGYQITAH